MSIALRPARESDVVAADAMLRAAFQRPSSFQPLVRLHLSLGNTQLWAAEDAGRLVGTVGAVNYGRIAYIGLMAVDPQVQRQGIARRLVECVLARLDEAGCPTVLLDATPTGGPLYEQFEFVDDATAYVLEPSQAAIDARVSPELTIQNRCPEGELVAFDEARFGACRQSLLKALVRDSSERLLVARNAQGRMVGYLFARDPTLGPWLAESAEVAESLLAAAWQLPFSVTPQVLVPASNQSSVDLLAANGFVERRRLRHMRRGARPTRQGKQLFGQSSFAHG